LSLLGPNMLLNTQNSLQYIIQPFYILCPSLQPAMLCFPH
jgi:hypothetical protein